MSLSEAEIARYARQLILPAYGPVTQEHLRAARVHVVGAGEVAGPALLYLAAAGVGTLFVDDALDVAAEDPAAWLYSADQLGTPRLLAALEALRAATSLSRPRAHATAADPTAVLVCASSGGLARTAAERARVAGVPHVVATAGGDGGEVIAVPPGAPCFACAARTGSGAPVRPGVAAAVGALGAVELLLILSGASQGPGGRRIELVSGRPCSSATARVPGCACGQGRSA